MSVDLPWQDRFELCSSWQDSGHSRIATGVDRSSGRPVWIEVLPFERDTEQSLQLAACLEKLKNHTVAGLAHVVLYQVEPGIITIVTEREISSITASQPPLIPCEQFLERAILLSEACTYLSRLELGPAAGNGSEAIVVGQGWTLALSPFPPLRPDERAGHRWADFCTQVLGALGGERISERGPTIGSVSLPLPAYPAELGWLVRQPGLTIEELAGSLREIRLRLREPEDSDGAPGHSSRTYQLLAGIMLALLTIWIFLAIGSH